MVEFKLLSKCSCGCEVGHMNGQDLVCSGCKKVLRVFPTKRYAAAVEKRFCESSYTRVIPQVDAFGCLRCGRVSTAAFVFDDGGFYCANCFDYMLGGRR